MRYIKWILGIPLVLIIILFTHYTLPGRDIVQIVGTDVKRMDIGKSSLFWASVDAGTNQYFTRDVRFINAVWPGGKPRVYRNEDTNWDWPPYLKFDSGNLTAQAQSLAKQDEAWVAVTHYGWRINFFTIFPNVISIKKVDGPDVFLFPWFNTFFFVMVGVLVFFVLRLLRRFKAKRIDPVLEDIDEMVDSAGENATEARKGIREYFKRWFG